MQRLVTIAVKLAITILLAGVLPSNETSHENAESNSPHATVLIFGRTVCSDWQHQFLAIQTQRQSLFKALSKRGFEVHAILATNDCGKNSKGASWEGELRRRYGSAVHSFVLDNCTGFLEDRCLLNRALNTLDEWDTAESRASDIVLFTRPDVLFKRRGYELTVDMISKPNSMLWPFKCEDLAWNKWKCAADTMVSLPARVLAEYRSKCLGRLSCHPEANLSGNSGPIPHFDDNEGGMHIGAGFSGRGCFRCASQALRGLKLRFGFADSTLQLRSNPREPAGFNRWYTFASEHLLRSRPGHPEYRDLGPGAPPQYQKRMDLHLNQIGSRHSRPKLHDASFQSHSFEALPKLHGAQLKTLHRNMSHGSSGSAKSSPKVALAPHRSLRANGIGTRRDCHWVDWKKKLECEELAEGKTGLAALSALAKSVRAEVDHSSAISDEGHKARVTILMHGQTARPHCSNKPRQWDAIQSQHTSLFGPLKNRGFEVNLLLATNCCSASESTGGGGVMSWESQLRKHYGPILTDLLLDNCDGARDKRCLIHRVLLLWDRQLKERADRSSRESQAIYEHERVLFTRPDMLFKARGSEMVLAMVAGSQNKMTWPFKCEDEAWKSWQCVADTLVSLPALSLAAYRSACLGHIACHPEAHQGGGPHMLRFDHSSGGHIAKGYQGHACYRCVKLATMRYREARDSKAEENPVASPGNSVKGQPASLSDQVWFGIHLSGNDFRAFSLKDNPAYESAVLAAVRTAEAEVASMNTASAPVASEHVIASGASRIAAAHWQPAAAAAVCETACKEAVSCRAWSAGAGVRALALEQGDTVLDGGEDEDESGHGLDSSDNAFLNNIHGHDRHHERGLMEPNALADAQSTRLTMISNSTYDANQRKLAAVSEVKRGAQVEKVDNNCKYVAWKKKVECASESNAVAAAGSVAKASNVVAAQSVSQRGQDHSAGPGQPNAGGSGNSRRESAEETKANMERAAAALAAKLVRMGASGHGAYCLLKTTYMPPSSPKNKGSGYDKYNPPQVVSGALGMASAGVGPNAVLGSLRLGFAWDVELRVNARQASGDNPFYTFASEHDFSTRQGGGGGWKKADSNKLQHGAAPGLHNYGTKHVGNGAANAKNQGGHITNGPALKAHATVGGMFFKIKKKKIDDESRDAPYDRGV